MAKYERQSTIARRDFLKVAISSFAAAVVMDVTPSLAGGLGHEGVGHSELAIYDDRFEAAHLFASHLQRNGINSTAINGDITDLWLASLKNEAASGDLWIAGVTTPSTLFSLEQLLSNYRMKLVVRTDIHDSTQHVGGIMADALRNRSHRGPGLKSLSSSTRYLGENDCLVAWLITPISHHSAALA
ncbi:hypothetical protein G6L26_027205 (plasmid) [Agrobacterium radiobacter]|uniref:Uncharacterized protein n=1 Tax=Agrobacterium tumefaciens str. B6 TaxID=1183423 RepID=A0A822VBS1_AGRTU|nr:hypothetical protein [Agrobacterium tumefaciens]MQB27888.1 hypothetical protein [Agrobacterium tumefaciens]NTA08337.1 hypothetical protein [Agrobacterium tumefaciens]NTB16159.1 hypothetical protein [Agrobacterium tumefaciens]CVI25387.1 hypothetical protein AGR4A_pAt30202 [Agrobacterium tumefaciens str. B6]